MPGEIGSSISIKLLLCHSLVRLLILFTGFQSPITRNLERGAGNLKTSHVRNIFLFYP